MGRWMGRQRRPKRLEALRGRTEDLEEPALPDKVVEQPIDHLRLGVQLEILTRLLELGGVNVQCLAHFPAHQRSPQYRVRTICIRYPYHAPRGQEKRGSGYNPPMISRTAALLVVLASAVSA